MDVLRQDLVYSLRRLRQSPGFTLVAVATLALGIGATSALFSVVEGVLLRPLPYPKPDQIVRLWEVGPDGNRMSFADPNFEDVRSQAGSLAGVAEYATSVVTVSGGAEPTRALVAAVSADFLAVFGAHAELGRAFAPDEHRFGSAPVALVSHDYWMRFLGGTTALSELKLTTDAFSAPVIGVLPAGFRFPDDADIWVPRESQRPRLPSRTAHNWRVVGRLRDGIALPAARAELATVAGRLRRQYGPDTMMTDVAVVPLREAITGGVRSALAILFGAAASLLLIAAANVVNMLLAQTATRARELAIRAALGAGRGRLVRQSLTEALLLSLGAGVVGVLFAVWGVDALRQAAPANLPRLDEVAVNGRVLLFATAVSIAVAATLGALIAWRATASDPQAALGEGSRGEAATVRAHRLGRLMVAGQLAATLVLLVGAGLLGRSLLRVLAIDPGFDRTRVVTIELALPDVEEEKAAGARARFLSELVARLRGVPGVLEAGGTNALPLAPGGADGTYVELGPQDPAPRTMEELERLFREATRTGEGDFRVASDGYFKALRIPLRQGRLFDERDVPGAPHAAVVSQSLARKKWPGQAVLGRRLEFGNMDGDLRPLVVVGVAGDVRPDSLEGPPRPTIYVDDRQRPRATSRFTIVMRTETDAGALSSAGRQVVRELDPTIAPRFRTLPDVVSASLDGRRFDLTLVGVFAATALLLAMAGVYGVTAYWVAQRTREIGVRMALGACGGDVVRLVLRQGLQAVAVGVSVGVGGSLLLGRTVQALLFGVSATDPPTLAGVAVVLVAVAGLAGYVPARRAARVDPMVALRSE